MVTDVGYGPDVTAGGGYHVEADQLMVVELIRIVGDGYVGRVDDEPRAAQLLRRVAVGDSGEADDQTASVGPGIGDRERAECFGLCGEHTARSEPLIWIVGPDFDRNLPADSVRAADTANDEEHAPQRTSSKSSRSTRT